MNGPLHGHFVHKACCRYRGLIAFPPFLLAVISLMPMLTARSQQEIILDGKIADVLTGKSLERATLSISGWVLKDEKGYDWYDSKFYANETGHYAVSLQKGHYTISVMADNPDTPGLDYVPVLLHLNTTELGKKGDRITLSFDLYPGASVRITGSAVFIEFDRAPDHVDYSLLDEHNGTPSLAQSVTYYDRRTLAALGLEPDYIVVPANMPILIRCISPEGNFTMDDNGSYFVFPKGSLTTIDVGKAAMDRNVKVVKGALDSTRLRVNEFAKNGINAKSEVDDLDTAFNYLALASLALRDRDYSQCYMNLRAAYIANRDIQARLEKILSDVAFSPLPLSFLMVLCGFGLASILVEKEHKKVVAGLSIGLLFIGFSYHVAPGWKLADQGELLASVALAASLAALLTTLFPRIKKDIVTPSGIAFASSLTSSFSLATRNLKRRRLRSSLMLASIFTMVFGFMVFTSFSFHATVVSGNPASPYPYANPPKGLMVVPPPASSAPLTASLVDMLREDPMVVSVAPKVDTSPLALDAQLMSEGGHSITVNGAIGVSSDEGKMNQLDTAVIKGHYMTEGENAILISAHAADELHVVPGSKVRFTWSADIGMRTSDFMVAGILDDRIFEWIVELNGQPIRPYYIPKEGQIIYINPESVIVLDWKELMGMQLGTLSRINIQTSSEGETVRLAAELARKLRYLVYATVGGEVKLFNYRRDPALSGGLAIPVVLVLVGLNVLGCALNAVYERRREIATLSLVGVNPSQISYIFLAEAGLVAFIGSVTGYLLGIGTPRMLLMVGGPGFLTEKVSWTWSVAAIAMSVTVAVTAYILPAIRASMMATPHLPRKWKLDQRPAVKDMWQLHIPLVVSKLELGRFIGFVEWKFKEAQLAMPGELELNRIIDESDQEREVIKVLFTYNSTHEGTRSFRTDNELVMVGERGSPTYSVDLVVRISTVYDLDPLEAVRRTASAVRWLTLRWTVEPSPKR